MCVVHLLFSLGFLVFIIVVIIIIIIDVFSILCTLFLCSIVLQEEEDYTRIDNSIKSDNRNIYSFLLIILYDSCLCWLETNVYWNTIRNLFEHNRGLLVVIIFGIYILVYSLLFRMHSRRCLTSKRFNGNYISCVFVLEKCPLTLFDSLEVFFFYSKSIFVRCIQNLINFTHSGYRYL